LAVAIHRNTFLVLYYTLLRFTSLVLY
jgi:hypothetical protein